MGALLTSPKVDKFNEVGQGNDLRYGISSMQGWRLTMEDAHCAITQLPGNLKDWSFFAVFDGHAGALVSALCASELLKSNAYTLLKRLKALKPNQSTIAIKDEIAEEGTGSVPKSPPPSARIDDELFALEIGNEDVDIEKCIVNTEEFKKVDPELAPSIPEIERGIRDGFLSLDNRLRQLPQLASGEDRSGSTAVCVLITPEHIFFANCGDSRAVLIRQGKVAFETMDHKPVNPTEKERIHNAGGTVITERVNGSLAVSRSLGDYAYKTVKSLGPTEQLISPEPEITVMDRNKELDETIVLACDGVWDVLSSEALCEMLQHRMRCTNDLSLVCNDVVDLCLYRGSSDNMSIVLVAFDPAPKVNEQCAEKDAQFEKLLLKRAQEFINKTPKEVTTDEVINNLQKTTDPTVPPFLVYCKGGKIQKLIEQHEPKEEGTKNPVRLVTNKG